MSGRIDQIQNVSLAILGFVIQSHGVCFDRDAALALEIHIIEDLRFHVSPGHCAGEFEQAIGQGRFAVIDVRNDGEVADAFRIHLELCALSR